MSTPVNTSSSEATTYITAITCEQMKDAEDYLREYILAWLDIAMKDDKNAFDVSLGLLHTVQQVYTFNDAQKCLDYLRSITEKRAFLVLSCTIDAQLLNEFLALPQLEYIYVFGRESILKKEHEKLVEVTSIHKLYSRLSTDVRCNLQDDDDTDFASLKVNTTIKSIQELEGDARVFIFYQFLIEILLRLPKTSAIKEQFISFCLEKTNNNPAQQKIFEESIRNYKPDDAIPLYTRPCFFHKLLNRTCRLGNIKDMFKLAFFMIDLNAQLKLLHNEYFDWYAEHIDVYRGRPMSTVEFNKLHASIGDLVVTKSFLSTTIKEDVARMYSGAGTQNPDFVPAILHMRINKQRNETKPFAFTRYHSYVRGDDEILISMGTIFRIDAEKCENGIHEFMLIRGNAEEKIEREVKSTFCSQANEIDSVFELNSSTNIKECCEKILEDLTASGDHTTKTLGDALSPKSTEKINTEPDPTIKTSVRSCVPLTRGINKRIFREVQLLRYQAKSIFILEVDPISDMDEISIGSATASSSLFNYNIIEGRILPTSEPYCQCSFRVRFTLSKYYPFDPPEVIFLTPIYHPSIGTAGQICNAMLNVYNSYNQTVSLSQIIRSIVELIDNPDIDFALSLQLALEYQNNRDEFNRKALDFVLRYGQPRA